MTIWKRYTSSDAYLNKYDSDGNLLWNITWNTSLYDEAYATAATEDCVYVAGDTAPSNVSDFDASLNKYDSDGNLLWNITWGGPGSYSATAAATSGDSVYVAGSGGHIGGRHAFLNKYDGDGNLVWNITCGSAEGKATATGDNAVYLAGYTLDHDAYLNKYDSTDGNLIWNITWSGAGGALGYATAASGDCVYLAGPDISTDCDFCNVYLNKYSSTDGSLIWNTTWGKTGWYSGQAIATIGDCMYLTGTTSSGSPKSHNFSVDTFLVEFSEPTPTPKITSTPSEKVTGECKTLWYFDEQSVKCQQKEFCGLYMLQRLAYL